MTVTKTKAVHPTTGKILTTDTQGYSYRIFEQGTTERLIKGTENNRALYGLAFNVELKDKKYNVVVFTRHEKFSNINPTLSSSYIYEVNDDLSTSNIHTSNFDRGVLNGGLTQGEWLATFGITDHIHFREGKAKILKYLGWYFITYGNTYNHNGKDSEVIFWYNQGGDGMNLCFSSSIKNHIIKPKAKGCVLAKPVHGWNTSYPLQLLYSVKAHKFRKPTKKAAVPYIDLEMIE
mgnify:CR=1 FL=1